MTGLDGSDCVLLNRAMKIQNGLETIASLRLIEDSLLRRIVVQVWPQPSLDFVNAHPFAIGVVGNLIAIDLPQAEVTRFRMGKVKTTHARCGPHRKGLRDLNSCVGANIQQVPERTLLGVIRAGWITRRRSDTAVFF